MVNEHDQSRKSKVEYYHDPLAGDVVMDATARLLAPKKKMNPAAENESPKNNHPGSERNSRKKPRSPVSAAHHSDVPGQKKPQSNGNRTDSAKGKAEKSVKAPKQQTRVPSSPQSVSHTKHFGSAKKSPHAGTSVPKTAKSPNHLNSGSPRKSAKPPHHPSQPVAAGKLDSTQQAKSLMKPYYFNPNED